ncbi:hypothetical protein B484DRAFT_459421 [Ochromonadaceae sp. CCMP2298]|nr:hypothetical protein B484DRAFT_459421 [Ochromonadaceae sp. CCMP2298]
MFWLWAWWSPTAPTRCHLSTCLPLSSCLDVSILDLYKLSLIVKAGFQICLISRHKVVRCQAAQVEAGDGTPMHSYALD